MYLKFESVSRPVLVAQGSRAIPTLVRPFAKWPYREVPADRSGEPALHVVHEDNGGLIRASWMESEQRYPTTAGLADGLATQLTRCWMQENFNFLGISAAAGRFGDEITVFVGGPQSGKSLLVACLSASGFAVFADSILPISVATHQGLSLGLAPRVRLPLPRTFSGALRTRISRRLDRCGAHAGYLNPDLSDIAGFGERAPIRAFVLLDRSDATETTLRRAAPGTLLKRLLLVSPDALPSARTTLALLHEMVTDIACYRLTWSDPSDAVRALRARFAMQRPPEGDDAARSAPPVMALRRRSLGPRRPAGRLFRHVVGLEAREIDGDMFLVDPDGKAIYHLNGLGTGLWRLLDGSHGLDDVISVLQDAFPTADPALIESDVAQLIADLTDRGLLVELPGAPTLPDRRPPTP